MEPQNPGRRSSLNQRQDLKRFSNLNGSRWSPSAAPGVPPTAPTNPFGNCLSLLEVSYEDQFTDPAGITTQYVPVENLLPPAGSITAGGLTVELWFNATSSGILLAQGMKGSDGTTPLAPLLYVNAQGSLAGGLFDGTSYDLEPEQTLVASPGVAGSGTGSTPPFIGAAHALTSPLSVIDGDWHHGALVVAAGGGRQSLYLDGRLVATSTGTFTLGFSTTGGVAYSALTTSQIGGTIIPVPLGYATLSQAGGGTLLESLGYTLPYSHYPQGFVGFIDELRIWNVERSPTELQQGLDAPLGTSQPTGLYQYLSFDNGQPSLASTRYMQFVPSTIPFDPFEGVELVPGYQNYWLHIATPYTSPSVDMSFGGQQPYSVKVGLRQGDLLAFTLPAQDDSHDNLSADFSFTVTDGVTQTPTTTTGVAPGTTCSVQASHTGVYKIDFSYGGSGTVAASVQFELFPGPSNPLLQLLLAFDGPPGPLNPATGQLLMAYSDPAYPLTPSNAPDPRPDKGGQTVPVPPYWPTFSDPTFVIPQGGTSDDLLWAYLELCVNAPSKYDFFDYFNLLAGGKTLVNPADIQSCLQGAYDTLTSQPGGGTAAPSWALNAVYQFISNVNDMRARVDTFFTDYLAWAQTNINVLLAGDVAVQVAQDIYNEQGGPVPKLVSTNSGGGLAANFISGAVFWGLGALLPGAGALFEEAAVKTATNLLGVAGGAGASAFSELVGTFVSSSSQQITLPTNLNDYQNLDDVANNISDDFTKYWSSLQTMLISQQFRQHVFSNYGLLQALQVISAASLTGAPQLGAPENPLTAGMTYTSWQTLFPMVFTWQREAIPAQTALENVNYAFIPSAQNPATFPSVPSGQSTVVFLPISISDMFAQQSDGQLLQNMLSKLATLQLLGGGDSCVFYTISSIAQTPVSGNSADSPPGATDKTGAVINGWYPVDQNGKTIASQLASKLTGVQPTSGSETCNYLGAGGGWYLNCANLEGAVTTWFDVFYNWSESAAASYCPGMIPATFRIDMGYYFNNDTALMYYFGPISDAPLSSWSVTINK